MHKMEESKRSWINDLGYVVVDTEGKKRRGKAAIGRARAEGHEFTSEQDALEGS